MDEEEMENLKKRIEGMEERLSEGEAASSTRREGKEGGN